MEMPAVGFLMIKSNSKVVGKQRYKKGILKFAAQTNAKKTEGRTLPGNGDLAWCIGDPWRVTGKCNPSQGGGHPNSLGGAGREGGL